MDALTLEVMKTYATEYPVNTATLSPTEDHVRPPSACTSAQPCTASFPTCSVLPGARVP